MSSGGNNAWISGGTFNSANGDFNIHNNHSYNTIMEEETAMKILCDNIAPGDFHDSVERHNPSGCHPETRKVILQKIKNWIVDANKKKLFMWLDGPVGAGKSTILQSIAEWCKNEGLLDASFYFSHIARGRNDHRLFIATLAYQLTVSIPNMRPHVARALKHDPAIFGRSLATQMKTLILEPLSEIAARQSIFIIIDGLDECGQPQNQQDLLSVLASAAQRSKIRLRFLIASRTEKWIRKSFNGEPLFPLTDRISLVKSYNPNDDISVFLTSKFSEIKQRHPRKDDIPDSWPSRSQMDWLIEKSSGQFIYASIVVKFLESPDHKPTERLNIIFGLIPPGKISPFEELDALYIHVLSSVHDIEAATNVLMYLLFFGDGVLVGANSSDSIPPRSLAVIENFLRLPDGELQIILAGLHSIIHIPDIGDQSEISLFHASLEDFLTDKARSGIFYIDAQHAHSRLASHCIQNVTHTLSTEFNGRYRISDRISYQELMRECARAYPTEDLLQILNDFNFADFLHLTMTQDCEISRTRIHADLPRLLKWIEKMSKLTGAKNLYTRYISHFDSFHKTQLSRYPTGPALYMLLTAATVPGSREGLDLQCLMRREFREVDNGILELILSASKTDYQTLLRGFLGSTARSGTYHIDNFDYIDLAELCLQYLLGTSRSTDVEQIALHLLTMILCCLPPEPQMAARLRENPVLSISVQHYPHSKPQMVELSRLIKLYMQECGVEELHVFHRMIRRIQRWNMRRSSKKHDVIYEMTI